MLPVIQSCDGCGACCLEQESPPGYLGMAFNGLDAAYDDEDRDRYENMPADARKKIEDYAAFMESNGWEHPNNSICIWFDEETRKCSHYEWRPSICRDELEINDEGCRTWRQHYGIDQLERTE